MIGRLVFSLQVVAVSMLISASAQASTCNGPFCGPWGYDTDGGYSPEVAGCTLQSSQDNCGSATVDLTDRCSANGELNEAVGESSCKENPASTPRAVNCNDYCMATYTLPGVCMTATVAACANDTAVGYCLCGDR